MLLNFPPIDLSSAACTVVMTPDANYLIPASRVGQMSIRFDLTQCPPTWDIYGRSLQAESIHKPAYREAIRGKNYDTLFSSYMCRPSFYGLWLPDINND